MNALATPHPFSTKIPLSQHPLHLKPSSPFQVFFKASLPLFQTRKKRGFNFNFKCKAELSQDAPFAVAIGASILNSFVFPLPKTPGDDDDDDSGSSSVIDSTDARFAVMGIISFIPYFNWLSWIFALLDTSNPRYVVYSIVYLAPYIRTNLSLSPEESWLPIASIIFCIIHVQLEASIRNGDIQGFQLFNEALKRVSPSAKTNDAELKVHGGISKKGRTSGPSELPSAQEHSRNKLHGWEVPEKLSDQLSEDEDADGR